MHSVTPVKITLPDGVERELRFTIGAKKMIVDLLGMPMQDALNKYDSGAFPEILWALMHDENGDPPDVSVKWLSATLPADSAGEIMAAIMSAATQGKTPKNELEALINAAMGTTSSSSSASQLSASDSHEQSSGGDTSPAKSALELTAI
jgi:hypothetical protein